MIPEQIEKIKGEFTDKYVAVSPDLPELARFKDHVGQVKTVNMSGRALVEFADYHLNIGWYDIDLDYLKVVDKPKPKEKKPAAKKAAAKPAAKKPAATGEKKLSPLELARMQGAAKAGGGGATDAKPAAEKPTTSKNKEKKPAAADRSKMSVADMLAAARGGAKPAAKKQAEPEPVAEAPDESPAEAETVEAPASASSSDDSSSVGPVDRSSMSVDDMLAYCREKDA